MLKGFHPERLSVNLLRGRQATRTLHTPQDLQSLLASSTKSTLPQTCHPHIKAWLVLQHGRPRVLYERHSIQSHRQEEQEHGSWRKAGSSFGFERTSPKGNPPVKHTRPCALPPLAAYAYCPNPLKQRLNDLKRPPKPPREPLVKVVGTLSVYSLCLCFLRFSYQHPRSRPVSLLAL